MDNTLDKIRDIGAADLYNRKLTLPQENRLAKLADNKDGLAKRLNGLGPWAGKEHKDTVGNAFRGRFFTLFPDLAKHTFDESFILNVPDRVRHLIPDLAERVQRFHEFHAERLEQERIAMAAHGNTSGRETGHLGLNGAGPPQDPASMAAATGGGGGAATNGYHPFPSGAETSNLNQGGNGNTYPVQQQNQHYSHQQPAQPGSSFNAQASAAAAAAAARQAMGGAGGASNSHPQNNPFTVHHPTTAPAQPPAQGFNGYQSDGSTPGMVGAQPSYSAASTGGGLGGPGANGYLSGQHGQNHHIAQPSNPQPQTFAADAPATFHSSMQGNSNAMSNGGGSVGASFSMPGVVPAAFPGQQYPAQCQYQQPQQQQQNTTNLFNPNSGGIGLQGSGATNTHHTAPAASSTARAPTDDEVMPDLSAPGFSNGVGGPPSPFSQSGTMPAAAARYHGGFLSSPGMQGGGAVQQQQQQPPPQHYVAHPSPTSTNLQSSFFAVGTPVHGATTPGQQPQSGSQSASTSENFVASNNRPPRPPTGSQGRASSTGKDGGQPATDVQIELRHVSKRARGDDAASDSDATAAETDETLEATTTSVETILKRYHKEGKPNKALTDGKVKGLAKKFPHAAVDECQTMMLPMQGEEGSRHQDRTVLAQQLRSAETPYTSATWEDYFVREGLRVNRILSGSVRRDSDEMDTELQDGRERVEVVAHELDPSNHPNKLVRYTNEAAFATVIKYQDVAKADEKAVALEKLAKEAMEKAEAARATADACKAEFNRAKGILDSTHSLRQQFEVTRSLAGALKEFYNKGLRRSDPETLRKVLTLPNIDIGGRNLLQQAIDTPGDPLLGSYHIRSDASVAISALGPAMGNLDLASARGEHQAAQDSAHPPPQVNISDNRTVVSELDGRSARTRESVDPPAAPSNSAGTAQPAAAQGTGGQASSADRAPQAQQQQPVAESQGGAGTD